MDIMGTATLGLSLSAPCWLQVTSLALRGCLHPAQKWHGTDPGRQCPRFFVALALVHALVGGRNGRGSAGSPRAGGLLVQTLSRDQQGPASGTGYYLSGLIAGFSHGFSYFS